MSNKRCEESFPLEELHMNPEHYEPEKVRLDVLSFLFGWLSDESDFADPRVDLWCKNRFISWLDLVKLAMVYLRFVYGPARKCLRDTGIDKIPVPDVVLLDDST